MPKTLVTGLQVKDGSIQRPDLDVTTVGQAVVAKLVQGTGITLSSTGADSGTGDVTINAAAGSTPDLNLDKLTITANQTVTAGYGAVIPRQYTINSGIKLTINSGGRLRIL